MKKFLSSLINITILLAFAFSLPWAALTAASCVYLPTMGILSWVLDLFSHFKIQYATIQCGLLILFGLCLIFKAQPKKFLEFAVGFNLLFLSINAFQLYPYYFTPRPDEAQRTLAKGKFRLLHINVLKKNRRVDLVERQIQKANADIVSLQEYGGWWRTKLNDSTTLRAYPYRYLTPSGDDGIYSRVPFDSVHPEYIPGSSHKSDVGIIAKYTLAGRPVTLLFSHTPTPIALPIYERQKKHFRFWAQNRHAYGKTLAIIGDLNTSPWSQTMRQLLQETGLHDSQLGFGVQRSFPTYDYRKSIPIDHCLVSRDFIILNRQLGHFVGSDHLPIIVDLALK